MGYVFPGQAHGKPLSNMALLVLLKRMNTGEKKWLDPSTNRPITAHGGEDTKVHKLSGMLSRV